MSRNLLFAFLIFSSLFHLKAFASGGKSFQVAVEATAFATEEFLKEKDLICQELAHQITVLGEGKYSGQCFEQIENNKEDMATVQIEVLQNKATITITMVNAPALMNGMAFKWKVPVDKVLWKKMITRFMGYIREENIEALKRYALNIGAAESAEIGKNAEGYYHRSTLEKLNEKEAMDLFLAEDHTNREGTRVKRNRHLLRAILEIGGVLLTGGGYYQFMDFDVDKDFEYNWEGIKGKFSSRGFRFDDNSRKFNLYAHPIAGTIYYTIGRANGLSSLESMLLAFTSSALWEFIPEFVEVASVNDQFQTAFTGPAIGEAMFQLGEFFNRGGNTIMHRILGAIMGPGLHNWIDGNKAKRAENLDQFGFDVDYWHRFNVYTEAAVNTQKEGIAYQLGFDMQLNTVPGIHNDGKEVRWRGDTLFVELASRLGLDGDQKAEFLFQAKSVYAGLVAKNIFTDKNFRKNGYALIFGPSSSYYFKDGSLGMNKDFFGLVNFLGTTLDMSLFIKDVKIRICLDVFASFTSVRSFALEKYRGQVPDSVIKSTLNTQDYFNGLGLVNSGKFEVEYKRLGLYVNGQHVMTKSLNGLERNQEKITDDLRLHERRLTVDTNLSYVLWPRKGLQIGVGHEYNYGESLIMSNQPGVGPIRQGQSEHTWFLRLGGRF